MPGLVPERGLGLSLGTYSRRHSAAMASISAAEVVEGRARLAVEDRIQVLLSSSREEGPRGLDHVAADEFQGASATGPILVRVSPDEIRGVIERMEKPDRR